jgi:predicted Zn-dependent peptidase
MANSLRPIEFTEFDLPNGLRVILHENHVAPVVSTYLLYNVGSKNERSDRTGFAHFFEHLMFEGSENIPRGQIDKYISGAGGNLNASTSFDKTDYYFNLPSNQLKLALWIESERMMHAKIDEKGVETQRAVVKEEKRQRVDNQPYGTLFEELSKMMFKGTPYEWVPIGSFQYIDSAKIEEFREFHRTYYVAKGAEVPRPKIEWALDAKGTTRDVEVANTPLPATLHAWRAPNETHPDAYAIELMTDVLAKGRSSRLYRRLVDKEAVAMSVEVFPYLLEKAGMIGVEAMGQVGVALETLDGLIREEIEKFIAEGATQEEYDKVLAQAEASFAKSSGTMSERARRLAYYRVYYGDTGLINTELQRYFAVKREDLQRVAKQYLTDVGRHVLRYPVIPKKREAKEGEKAR